MIMNSVNASVEQTAQKIVNYIDERSLVNGIATVEQMENIINNSVQNTLGQAGVLNLLQDYQNNEVVNADNTPVETNTSDNRFQLYNHGNRMGLVPRDFTFPQCSIAIAYQLWCCGDERKGHPPFRMLSSRDMTSRTLAARLSEFQFIMRRLDALTGFTDIRCRDLRLNQVIQCFNEQCNNLPISQQTPTGRQRRIGQLNWRSCYNIIKQAEQSNRNHINQ